MIGSTRNEALHAPPPDRNSVPDRDNPVVAALKQRIADGGPISIATFMEIALGHAEGGYYTTRDPFGMAGDFTTAPEISQMFGELIGLWCVDTWQAIGAPSAFALVELGPGRGTLMADALRAMDQVPACRNAASLHLVETSPVLREHQQKTLRGHNVTWHTQLPELGATPAIFLANEFLDALPVEQYLKHEGTWCERVVTYDSAHHRFCFALDRSRRLPPGPHTRHLATAPEGEIFEYAPQVRKITADIAYRICLSGGAALIIDYGYDHHATGQSLQAVRKHRPADPLEDPGQSDLTAHVNFQLLGETARAAGAKAWGPVEQGVFLQRLGIHHRANSLLKRANVSQAHDIRAAVNRLTDPAQMGTLFRAFAMTGPAIERLAGFDSGG